MKKTFIYLFSVFLAGISFTSCLGDTESSTTASDFAVIQQTEDYTYYARVSNGLAISWTGLSSKYNVGDALVMTYTVDLNQYGGIYSTDPQNIQEQEYYPSQNQLRINVGENTSDTIPENNPYKFETLNLRGWSPYEDIYKDKFLFYVKAKIKDGQTMVPVFSYDTADGMQRTSTGADLPENTIIIDVRLVVRGDGNPGSTETSKEENFVVNFEDIRNKVFDNSSTENKECIFWLRYYNAESTTRPHYQQSNIGRMYYIADTNK
ncbi:MAG TPA: hypothetical protein DIT04_05890 [Dysgonomonas sp.]|nr:hypothetical protein [Dysgonomonas sp.]